MFSIDETINTLSDATDLLHIEQVAADTLKELLTKYKEEHSTDTISAKDFLNMISYYVVQKVNEALYEHKMKAAERTVDDFKIKDYVDYCAFNIARKIPNELKLDVDGDVTEDISLYLLKILDELFGNL